jgi:hypothetical protein
MGAFKNKISVDMKTDGALCLQISPRSVSNQAVLKGKERKHQEHRVRAHDITNSLKPIGIRKSKRMPSALDILHDRDLFAIQRETQEGYQNLGQKITRQHVGHMRDLDVLLTRSTHRHHPAYL